MFSAKINCRCMCRSPAGQILAVGETRRDSSGLQKIDFYALFLRNQVLISQWAQRNRSIFFKLKQR